MKKSIYKILTTDMSKQKQFKIILFSKRAKILFEKKILNYIKKKNAQIKIIQLKAFLETIKRSLNKTYLKFKLSMSLSSSSSSFISSLITSIFGYSGK